MAERRKGQAHLWELIEEAIADCYGDDEQHGGLLTMIEENVDLPFSAKVIGEAVEVVAFAWPEEGHGLYAVCQRGGKRHRIDVNSLEWVKPYPKGFEWIEAYLLWRKGMG
ncbi:MAG: calcium-binding protein [Acidobacteriota bacterium]